MRAPLFLVLSLAGCTLLSKGTPMEVRYFSPETVQARHAEPPADSPRPRVLLGRLTSSASLRYRIVHRDSPVETGAYDTLRWTDNPEVYVRRSLVAALSTDRLELATGGGAPTLDVEVVGFEEVRRDRYHGGRVELRYQLRDERSVFASDVVVTEREAVGPGFEPVVVAIGGAMDAATASVATAVAARMSR